MLIARSLEELSGISPNVAARAVTVGNFDGVHLGHLALVDTVREQASFRNIPSMAITFDPHPATVVRGDARREPLTPLPRKLELLDGAGLDAVLVLPFTPDMAAMSPERFLREILLPASGNAVLVIGFNFALGRDRAGDFAALRRMGADMGFSVTTAPAYAVGGEIVSSSLIRGYIRAGNMEAAGAALGRPHSIDGEVVEGARRGRLLGFPTANLRCGDAMPPPPGVYATWAERLSRRGEKPLMSVTSVGTNPTFGGETLTVEVHVFNFTDNIYAERLRVHCIRKLRDPIRFDGADALRERIAADIALAGECLGRNDAAEWERP
jgi:riboflavin kinase/FMN adenylyltransferase